MGPDCTRTSGRLGGGGRCGPGRNSRRGGRSPEQRRSRCGVSSLMFKNSRRPRGGHGSRWSLPRWPPAGSRVPNLATSPGGPLSPPSAVWGTVIVIIVPTLGPSSAPGLLALESSCGPRARRESRSCSRSSVARTLSPNKIDNQHLSNRFSRSLMAGPAPPRPGGSEIGEASNARLGHERPRREPGRISSGGSNPGEDGYGHPEA
jgi:hypothetical protein